MCVCMCDTRCAPEYDSKEEYIVGNTLATSIKKKTLCQPLTPQ